MTRIDAAKAAEMLRDIYGGPRESSVVIGVEPSQNLIYVTGTEDRLRDVQATVNAFDGTGGFGGTGGNLRVFTLPKGGSAAALAEVLQQLLPNPVQVTIPGVNPTPVPLKPREGEPGSVSPQRQQGPEPPKDKPMGGTEEQDEPKTSPQGQAPQPERPSLSILVTRRRMTNPPGNGPRSRSRPLAIGSSSPARIPRP